MNKLIPIGDIAHYFSQVCNVFFHQTKSTYSIEVPQCLCIIHAIFQDELTNRLLWCLPSSNLQKALALILPWFDYECNDAYSDYFYSKIIDSLIIHVNEILDTFIPLKTWLMYECHQYGSEIIIVKGCDYRIYDWESRRARGEFTLDKQIRNRDLWRERISPKDVKDKRYDGKPTWPKPLSSRLVI